MGEWIVSVCGVVLLSLICDVIMPDGENKKYIKTVVGVVVSFVMVVPLLGIFGDISNDVSIADQNISAQESFLQTVQNQRNAVVKDKISLLFDSYNLDDYSISAVEEKSIVVQFSSSLEMYSKICEALENISDDIVIIWSESNV